MYHIPVKTERRDILPERRRQKSSTGVYHVIVKGIARENNFGQTREKLYFKKVINIFKQMNYSEYESEQFKKFNEELDALLKERMK